MEKDKFEAYVNQKSELQSEEALDIYYREYDGLEEDEVSIKFWQQTIFEYTAQVNYSFTVKVDDLMRKFTLHDRIPCGLPAIMKEMSKRKTLATKE